MFFFAHVERKRVCLFVGKKEIASLCGAASAARVCRWALTGECVHRRGLEGTQPPPASLRHFLKNQSQLLQSFSRLLVSSCASFYFLLHFIVSPTPNLH